MQKKLTIHDIARIAGVSQATVSRVLNHKPSVDPRIREHVMKVVNEHGFVPSVAATILRGGRTQLIGVLAPPLTSPFVPEIMLGVAEVTERSEYEAVLYMMNPTHKHSDVLDRILAMKLSMGFLAIMPGHLGPHLDQLSRQGVPIVTIEDQLAPISTPWVGIDNVSGAYEATRYLLSLGYRRIAHITGPEGYLCTVERLEGYSRALHEAGLEPRPELIWQGDFTVAGGKACAEEFLGLDPDDRPEAVFTANDQTAFGVFDAAQQRGVRIPDDLAVIGFDDMMMSPFTKPGLTTIRQPHREMGALACELLLSLIDPQKHPFTPEGIPYTTYQGNSHPQNPLILDDGLLSEASETFSADSVLREQTGPSLRILLPTRLIVRESCRPA